MMAAASLAQTKAISPEDLKGMEGSWSGTLTYVDYSSNKPTKIRSDLKVTRTPKTGEWIFEYLYPLEPKANSRTAISLSSDGRYFDEEEVIDRKTQPDGSISLITTKRGKDNGRNATFRRIFSVAPDSLSIRKEVNIDGTDTYFERNTYWWTRQR
jgi:hypothetical protein